MRHLISRNAPRLVSIAFGAVLCAHPGIGAITLALVFGLFNLAYGTWALVHGIEVRRTRKTLHSAVRETDLADTKPSPVHAPFRRPVHQ